MVEKIIVEKSDLSVGNFSEAQSHVIPFPEIEKHLLDGWLIKQMVVTPYGVNKNTTDLVITVHLERSNS